MKKVSNDFKAAISSDKIKFFMLIELHFNQEYYFTTTPSDISFRGNTYAASGGLLGSDTPRISTAIDKETFRLILSDLSGAMVRDIRTGITGADIRVYLGLYGTNGLPLLSADDDLMLAYRGHADSSAITNDFSTNTIIVEGASPFANLDVKGGFPVSKSGMDQVNTADTSYDNLFKGSNSTVEWGKK